MIYDLIIIGGGAAGIMAALEVAASSNLTVAVLEKAKRLNDARNIGYCWMGASARSAARIYNDPTVGGSGFSSEEFALFKEQMEHFYGNTLKFKAAKPVKQLNAKLAELGFTTKQNASCVLNEEAFIKACDRMHLVLKSNINIYHKVDVLKIEKRIDDGKNLFEITTDDVPYQARNIIVSTGRSSQSWWESVEKNFKLDFVQDEFDIGIRIEMPSVHFDKAFPKDWDTKMYWNGWKFSVPVRRMNVETEESGDLKIANSRTIHSGKKSYTSFSIKKVYSATDAATAQYRLCALANVLADFQLTREPVSKLIDSTSVLSSIPEYSAFIDPVKKISELVPAVTTKALFYGPEANLNVRRYTLDSGNQTTEPGVYIVGDMSGHTKSFVQASCSGIRAALAVMASSDSIKTKKKREVLRYDIIEAAAKRKSKKTDSTSV